jgi:hypothetical protein
LIFIDDLRHVDAGIKHIHGNGDVRGLVLLGEVVDEALRIFREVVDDAFVVDAIAGEFEIHLPNTCRRP